MANLQSPRGRRPVRAAGVDEQGGIGLRPPEGRRLRENRGRRRRAVVFYLHRARIIHGYARNASLVDDVDGREKPSGKVALSALRVPSALNEVKESR